MNYANGTKVWIVQEPFKVTIIRRSGRLYLIQTNDNARYWVDKSDIISD